MFWKDVSDRASLATGNFAKIFANIDIPPLPQVAMRVVEIAQQPTFDIEELSDAIASDTGLAAKVLQFVNSSHFGLRNRVTDIRHGVLLCGPKRIQTVAMALATAQSLPVRANGFDRLMFWQEALQRAVFAQILTSRIAQGMEGEAFTAALLQNMALPVLLSKWGTHYLPIVDLSKTTNRPLVEVEDEHLTWNHAQAGAWIARNWGFLDVLVCGIGLHHCSLNHLDSLDLLETPVAAVAVSAQLPKVTAIDALCREYLKLKAGECREFLETTDATCGELAQLFGVPEPAPLAPRLS